MSDFIFTNHARMRGLERILGKAGPYTQCELEGIEKLVRANMVKHPFENKWTLPSFHLELVIVNNKVVTIKEPVRNFFDYEHQNMKKMRKEK